MQFKTYGYGEVWCESTGGKRKGLPLAIVLHHTAGNTDRANEVQYLKSNPRGVSIHYHVAKDGYKTRMVPDDVVAFHVGYSTVGSLGNPNEVSLGIEISNRGTGKDPYPADQVDSVAEIVAGWMHKYYIRMITPHAGIDTKGKIDPYDFPWGWFWLYTTARLNALNEQAGEYAKCQNL